LLKNKKIVILVDSDSQIYGSLPYAYEFSNHGWSVVFCISKIEIIPTDLVRRVSSRFEVFEISIDQAPFSHLILRATCVFVMLSGSAIYRFRETIASVATGTGKRPILITAFNGLSFEAFEEGLAWRMGYDALCLNGPRDLAAAKNFLGQSDFSDQKFVMTGLIRKNEELDNKPRRSDPRSIVFAEQVIVPRIIYERRWIFHRLVDLARNSPSWKVIIKPRVSMGEKTFHKEILRPETAISGIKLPTNFSVDYRQLNYILSEVNSLITISSTSFFDALQCGRKAYTVLDFGVRCNIGTHFFWNSGAGVWLNDIESFDELPPININHEWLHDVGADGTFSPSGLVVAIEAGEVNANNNLEGMYSERLLPLRSSFTNSSPSSCLNLNRKIPLKKFAVLKNNTKKQFFSFDLVKNLMSLKLALKAKSNSKLMRQLSEFKQRLTSIFRNN
jgi:hypothetical protein